MWWAGLVGGERVWCGCSLDHTRSGVGTRVHSNYNQHNSLDFCGWGIDDEPLQNSFSGSEVLFLQLVGVSSTSHFGGPLLLKQG